MLFQAGVAMGSKYPNPRLIKIHRTYTVEELASRLAVHVNTVRDWRRNGLEPIDRRRPVLFQGLVVVGFLEVRRRKAKRPCRPGEIFCVRCREPRTPAANQATYQALTPTRGNLVGTCPICAAGLYRRVSIEKLAAAKGDLDVRFPEALQHIDESH